MSSVWGNHIKLSIFGESHGKGIGVVIDGLPAGFKIDMEDIAFQQKRRAPGRDAYSTPRAEMDAPQILSGIYKGHTTGEPLCALIANTNVKSKDYASLSSVLRPGHSDFAAYIKFKGFHDPRGGGHFSGRLTAPLVFAGSVCRQLLIKKGIEVFAHIHSIQNIEDETFDKVCPNIPMLRTIAGKDFPVINEYAGELMKKCIDEARIAKDSVGGIIEAVATGVPAGLGGHIFDSVESRLSAMLFSVPAVKGVEFGIGFEAGKKRGSVCNDPFRVENGHITTKTNNHGGILGGISSGMPIVFRVAMKPTPTISLPQESVDIKKKANVTLEAGGRHDPCIVHRALPVIEAASCVVLLDMLMDEGMCKGDEAPSLKK